MHGKIWAARRGVQLIVFFAAIREILKKEIYARDKQRFCAMKIKGKLMGSRRSDAGLQIQQIRFVNRSRFEKSPFFDRRSKPSQLVLAPFASAKTWCGTSGQNFHPIDSSCCRWQSLRGSTPSRCARGTALLLVK
jgi:hypothetical protein